MHIAITYDLKSEYLARGYSDEEVAEFDRPETIDAIEAVLRNAGHTTCRIGSAGPLIQRVAQGERWDLVFNIAEGLHGAARESQVPAILDAVGVPYTFSDPLVMAVCLDKRLAKHVVRERGISTPDFRVIERPSDVKACDLPFPLFAKPLAEGTSRGVTAASRVDNPEALQEVCADLLARYRQPVLVERYLPGREFTVGILGTGEEARTIGALEVHLEGDADKDSYSYDNKQLFEGRVRYSLASVAAGQAAMEVALAAYRALGCRDGGRVDVRNDEAGNPSFIEANPLAGLNPDISDLAILAQRVGLTYPEMILAIVQSAAARVPAPGQDSSAVLAFRSDAQSPPV